MTSTNTFHVVRFVYKSNESAGVKDFPVQVILISDAEYNQCVQTEPSEGYKVFERLHTFNLDDVSPEALQRLTALAV
jgi:hypothetical protein